MMYKLLLLFFSSLSFFCVSSAAGASESFLSLITRHKSLFTETAYCLLMEQYDAYAHGKGLKIVDSCIKEIPIKECGEPLVDLVEQNNERIISHLVHKQLTGYTIPACAAKMRISRFEALQRMLTIIDDNAHAFGYEKGQITIIAFEALRDLATQEKYFKAKEAEIAGAHPEMTEDEIFNETTKWLSPVRDNVPVHSTGAAIDIHLWDTQNKGFIDLGPFGTIFGPNPVAPTFSEELTQKQKENRLLLLIAAAQAGLVNYSYEWWHFSLGDRYAAFWLEKKAHKRGARYGSVA